MDTTIDDAGAHDDTPTHAPRSLSQEDLFYNLQSPDISKLAEALAKAQGEIKNAYKDTKNHFYKANYADLSAVRDACKEPLARHGLSVIQHPTIATQDRLVLVTTLLHQSGQWARSVLPIRPVKDDPQGLGSAITYMRRYALAAIVGVAPDDDDDGNAASGHTPPAPYVRGQMPSPAHNDQIEARRLATQIKEQLTNANSLEEVKQVFAHRQVDLADLKSKSAKTYDHLQGIYQERLIALDNSATVPQGD